MQFTTICLAFVRVLLGSTARHVVLVDTEISP